MPKGCKVRVQPESIKSVTAVGFRLPKADLECRVIPVELLGRRTREEVKEWRVKVRATG